MEQARYRMAGWRALLDVTFILHLLLLLCLTLTALLSKLCTGVSGGTLHVQSDGPFLARGLERGLDSLTFSSYH